LGVGREERSVTLRLNGLKVKENSYLSIQRRCPQQRRKTRLANSSEFGLANRRCSEWLEAVGPIAVALTRHIERSASAGISKASRRGGWRAPARESGLVESSDRARNRQASERLFGADPRLTGPNVDPALLDEGRRWVRPQRWMAGPVWMRRNDRGGLAPSYRARCDEHRDAKRHRCIRAADARQHHRSQRPSGEDRPEAGALPRPRSG